MYENFLKDYQLLLVYQIFLCQKFFYTSMYLKFKNNIRNDAGVEIR